MELSASKPAIETFRIVTLVNENGQLRQVGIPANPARRREGRTMLQMLDAPQGAVFVWPDPRSLWYPKDMQRALQRPDLRVIAAVEFARPGFAYGNTAQVVVDHGVWLLDPWPYGLAEALNVCDQRGLYKLPD